MDMGKTEDGICLKRAGMIEKLTALDLSRQAEAARRRSQTAHDKDPKESFESFLTTFNQFVLDAQQKLDSFPETRPSEEMEASKASRQAELDSMAEDILAAEMELAGASYYLPERSQQTCQLAIARLKERVEVTRAQLLPRKKFSFSAKKQRGAATQLLAPSSEEATPTPSGPLALERARLQDLSQAVCASAAAAMGPGVRDQEGAVISPNPEDLRHRDYTLRNLRKCTIFLDGPMSALFIHGLEECKVYAGPVHGSVHIEDVKDSVLMLASHQIRIHSTTNSDFYLRVRSRPVVEYTTGVRFAPYVYQYAGLDAELRAANLAEDSSMWENVDDFRWLRAVPSPNWSVVPASERIARNRLERLETQ